MPLKERTTQYFRNAISWYKAEPRNKVIVWELVIAVVIACFGLIFYTQNRLHEEDVIASNVPDVYVSPVRYTLDTTSANTHIYELECRVINRSAVAITTTDHVVIALTDETRSILDEYGETIHLYPVTIPNEVILQDAQVGYKLAYSPAEMTSGAAVTAVGEYNAYLLSVQGDILYEEGAECNPETESPASRPDGYAHLDKVDFKLVISCPTDDERSQLKNSLFVSVEVEGSYNANSGTLYILAEDQNITEQAAF